MNELYTAVADSLSDWGNEVCAIELRAPAPDLALSGEQLLQAIDGQAKRFAAEGVGSGVLAALFLENSVDFVVSFFALQAVGAVPVIGKVEYRSLELTELFANSDPAVVIAEESALEQLEPWLSGRLLFVRTGDGILLKERGSRGPVPGEVANGVASINYTYRGLGYSLGAVLSPEQYLRGAEVLQAGLQGDAGDRMLFAIPMTHIFTLVGCILVPILYRMPMVIGRSVHPRRTVEAIQRYGINHITAVPELYNLLLRTRDPKVALPTLKTFVSGGSFLSEDLYHALRESFGIDLLHGYGLTEFTPVSRNIRNHARPGTVGPLCGGVDCRLADGESGEILVRTDSMRMEYYRRPEESLSAREGGWFKTGDAGHFEDRHLVFDREIKRTCKVNGLLVDLEEVRRALLLHPGISEAAVERREGVVTARVSGIHLPEGTEKAREVRNFLRNHVAAYKIPTKVT